MMFFFCFLGYVARRLTFVVLWPVCVFYLCRMFQSWWWMGKIDIAFNGEPFRAHWQMCNLVSVVTIAIFLIHATFFLYFHPPPPFPSPILCIPHIHISQNYQQKMVCYVTYFSVVTPTRRIQWLLGLGGCGIK